MRHPPKSIDWEKYKIEWLNSTETLNQFRERYKITSSWFYKKIAEAKWVEIKEQITKKAMQKTVNGLAKETAQGWIQYQRAQDGLVSHVQDILRKAQDNEGTIVRSLPASDVRQLASALKDLTQNQSFISGGPTERIDSRNIHMDVVEMLDQIEKEK